jgi:hypothetical protein
VLADLRHGSGAMSKTGTAIALAWCCRECVTAANQAASRYGWQRLAEFFSEIRKQ